MSDKILSAIHDGLGWALLGALGSQHVESYRRQWIAGARDLADGDIEFRELFRKVLLFTRSQNRKFRLDNITADTINRMVLEKFLGTDGPMPTDTLGAGPTGSLANDPGAIPSRRMALPPDESRLGNSAAVQTPMQLVFHAMLQSLCSRFDSRIGRSGVLKSKFLSKLPGLKLSAGASHAIRNWASSEHFNGSMNAVSENEMREVIDGIYTICCDEFGPVMADDLLSESAQAVQQIPEAVQYPVQRLL